MLFYTWKAIGITEHAEFHLLLMKPFSALVKMYVTEMILKDTYWAQQKYKNNALFYPLSSSPVTLQMDTDIHCPN